MFFSLSLFLATSPNVQKEPKKEVTSIFRRAKVIWIGREVCVRKEEVQEEEITNYGRRGEGLQKEDRRRDEGSRKLKCRIFELGMPDFWSGNAGIQRRELQIKGEGTKNYVSRKEERRLYERKMTN